MQFDSLRGNCVRVEALAWARPFFLGVYDVIVSSVSQPRHSGIYVGLRSNTGYMAASIYGYSNFV